MAIRKESIRVEGLTCASCERRVEGAVRALPGVSSAKASVSAASVAVEYDARSTTPEDLRSAISGIGYTALPAGGGRAASLVALGIGVILVAAYLAASASGAFSVLPVIDSSLGYGMLLVAGLLTSVHCVAMCGGIALSQSVPKNPADRPSIRPALLYNGGRLVSYTIIGGIVGAVGSVFAFSPAVKGAIAAAAGLFMVVVGLRMLGLSPVGRLGFRPLKPLRAAASRAFGGRLRSRGPFAVGLLNGFMPCGPLQTMQLYALGTGSFIAGAASMFVFAAGTFPLLFVFGTAAAALPRRFVPVLVRSSAVLVLFLGAVTVVRAASLAGLSVGSVPGPSLASSAQVRQVPAPTKVQAASKKAPTAIVENGRQTIVTEIGSRSYVPFTVRSGVPLTWIVRVSAANLNGCNNAIIVPAYGIEKQLVPGDNVIEFTPKASGTIPYSCWMGMIRSRITVVDASS